MNETLEIPIEKSESFRLEKEGLFQKTIRGGGWVFTLNILDKGLNFVKVLILARLLTPEDFGLVGIAWLAILSLETFSQTGFQAALIQRKGKIDEFLDTAWVIQFLRGILLFALLFFLAPLAEKFFNSSGVTPVLRFLGLTLIIGGLSNIGMVTFIKELNFRKQFAYQISGTLSDFLVAIPFALILRDVWALAWGQIAGATMRTIVSYFLHPYKPRLKFDLEKAHELFSFGRWVTVSTIIIFFFTNGDNAFVGKFLGITALGLYQMAYRISNLPATEIAHVISQVAFPAYSKLQESLPRLKEAYLKVFQLIVFLAFPAAGLIFVLASDFTKIFLGEKWMPMVPAMQVLCIFGVTRALNATTGSIFQAVGRPSIIAKVSFIQLIFLAVIIYPLVKMSNLVGVAWAVTLANFLCFVLAFREVLQIINESKTKIVRAVFPSLLATVITICVIYLFRALTVGRVSIFITFFLSILIGFGMYSIYAKLSGFSFSSFLNSGSLFKKSVDIKTWEK